MQTLYVRRAVVYHYAMLLFKLTVTPLLMGAATLITRIWGPLAGGLFTALPLTSGPVSAFLFLEQGRAFAQEAAVASMLGYGALAFFILVFARLARWGTLPACLGSAATYFATAWMLSFLPRHNGVLACITAALCISVVLWLLPRGKGPWFAPRPAWWDLPGRMLLAGAMVLAVTGLAQALGPQWSGILSTYPVFITLMGIFTLLQAGQGALCILMRGFVEGLYGSSVFFLVLQITLDSMHPALAYGLASLANLCVCAVDVWLVRRAARRAAR